MLHQYFKLLLCFRPQEAPSIAFQSEKPQFIRDRANQGLHLTQLFFGVEKVPAASSSIRPYGKKSQYESASHQPKRTQLGRTVGPEEQHLNS